MELPGLLRGDLNESAASGGASGPLPEPPDEPPWWRDLWQHPEPDAPAPQPRANHHRVMWTGLVALAILAVVMVISTVLAWHFAISPLRFASVSPLRPPW